MVKTCAYCGKEIPEERKTCNRVKYCSEACMRKANRHKTDKQKEYAKERSASRNRYYGEIMRRYDCSCAICGWSAGVSIGRTGSYGCEIHHIVPVKEGGTNDISNLILLCPNHHKLADAGLLSKSALYSYQISDEDAAVKYEREDYELACRLYDYYHDRLKRLEIGEENGKT